MPFRTRLVHGKPVTLRLVEKPPQPEGKFAIVYTVKLPYPDWASIHAVLAQSKDKEGQEAWSKAIPQLREQILKEDT